MLYKFEDKKEIYAIDGVTGYELAQLEKYAIVYLTIEKEIPAHEVPLEMTFTVLDGSGIAIVDKSETTVSKGDVMTVVPNVIRGWRSTGETPLVLLAIRGNPA